MKLLNSILLFFVICPFVLGCSFNLFHKSEVSTRQFYGKVLHGDNKVPVENLRVSLVEEPFRFVLRGMQTDTILDSTKTDEFGNYLLETNSQVSVRRLYLSSYGIFVKKPSQKDLNVIYIPDNKIILPSYEAKGRSFMSIFLKKYKNADGNRMDCDALLSTE